MVPWGFNTNTMGLHSLCDSSTTPASNVVLDLDLDRISPGFR